MNRLNGYPLRPLPTFFLCKGERRENLMSQSWDKVKYHVRHLAAQNDRTALTRLKQLKKGYIQFHPLSPEGLYRKMQLQKWRCIYCGKFIEFGTCHLDHVYPIRKRGAHRLGNIALSCPSCNSKKHAHTLIEWLGWQRYLKAMRVVDDINAQLEREGLNPWNYIEEYETPIDDLPEENDMPKTD